MDKQALEKRTLACVQRGCGPLVPSTRVLVVRGLLADEQRAARQRRLSGLQRGTQAAPLRKYFPTGLSYTERYAPCPCGSGKRGGICHGKRGPTSWQRIGERVGMSGKTVMKEWRLSQAIEKDPRLAWLMEQADRRGIDAPYQYWKKIQRGWPTQVTEAGKLVLKREHLDPDNWWVTDALAHIRIQLELLGHKLDDLFPQLSPEDRLRLIGMWLETFTRVLWKRYRQEWDPERMKRNFGAFVDKLAATPAPRALAPRRAIRWSRPRQEAAT